MKLTARLYLSVVAWLTFVSFNFTSIAFESAWEREKQIVSTYNQGRHLFSDKGPSAFAHTLASIPGIEFPSEVNSTLIKYLSTDIGSYLPEMRIDVEDHRTFNLFWGDQFARIQVEDSAKGYIRVNDQLVVIKWHKSFEYNLVRVLNALGFKTKDKTGVSWFFSAIQSLGLFFTQLNLIPMAQAACPAGTVEHHPGHCVPDGGDDSSSSGDSSDESAEVTSSSNSSSSSGSARRTVSSSSAEKKSNKGIIIAAVVILLLLLLFFWNKNRKKKAESEASGHVGAQDSVGSEIPLANEDSE